MNYSHPSNNTYFGIGARVVNETLNEMGVDSFLFIDFRRENLLSLLPSKIELMSSGRYVIILNDTELMPLALYYIKNDCRFNVIFDSSTGVEVVINSLKMYEPGKLIMIIKNLTLVCLTKDEVDTFDLYAYLGRKGGDRTELINKKKYYRLTKSIATKMNRRRFANLFYVS